ncbi:MAG: NERD domain-containing protein [Anaerolineales bacterium]
MKIIDKTPFVDEKGNLGFQQRVQGMLQFGFNWPKQLEVQKAIATFFERQLEKGYTLLRNVPLGSSGIVVPMILLGPAGIFVISIIYEKGRYEAKGDTWNVESGNAFKPAPKNEIRELLRYTRALTAFIERQGTRIPVDIEPVLIAGDPGVHIESNKPAARILLIDGIKSFVTGLATGRPVMGSDSVYEITDRILDPRPPKKISAESAIPTVPPAAVRSSWEQQSSEQEVSRARAIFDASEQATSFNPNDFGFAMNDEDELPEISPVSPVSEEPVAPKASKPKKQRILGMEIWQLAVIVALVLCLLALVGGFAYAYFLNR